MITTMNHKAENMVLLSTLYPDSVFTTQMVPPQGGEPKQRRRRKRSKGDGSNLSKKRKLTTEQLNLLELSFGNEQKLETERKDKLAFELDLDPRQVAIWFQNRRARWKTKKVEEELSQLQTSYESVLLEKCNLESEVLMLREQLSEAERRIQQLMEPNDVISSNSPIASTVSMETVDAPLLREFGLEAYEDLFYLPPYSAESFYLPCTCMEWINYLCMY